jgi:hypothetical protein
MSNTDYIEKINDLRIRVNPYSNLSTLKNSKFLFKIPKIDIKSNIFYILVPIIILLLLMYIKPSFIMVKTINKNREIRKRLNYSKLFIMVLIIGFIIDVVLWCYIRKY